MKRLRVDSGTTKLGAVVLMVSIVVPLPATDGGTKLHVLSEGRPEQAKVVAPLKPFEPATLIVVVAGCPGLGTVIADGDAETVKSGFDETFTVMAGEVDAPKFVSPGY
jgi:hypothetical protein